MAGTTLLHPCYRLCNDSLLDLSVKQLRRAVVIKQRLSRLASELAQLLGEK